MSALAERLATLGPKSPGTPCQTCVVLSGMDAEDAAALRALLNAPKGDRVGADTLARALTDAGVRASRQSIEKHRRDGHE